jgi:3-methyladenine DNA glycosylase Tag
LAREYGAPEQIKPKALGDYLEVMSKAVFQSGISWDVVNKKWPGTQDAFKGFDATSVASLTEKELAAISTDTRVIRNRKKIEAIVDNARTMIDLDEEYGGFKNYLGSQGGFEPLVKDLKKRFRFLGETGCYYFLYVVGEPVPDYDTWCESRGVRHMHRG